MEFSRSFKLKKQNGGVLKVENKVYLCIDLKSFYASVECVERGLDPLTTNLAVADPERTEKTICLAISPSMKALGIRNRCRVFEIPGNVEYIMAPPRMKLYMEYSVEIYGIYLKYIAKEDIHVYSFCGRACGEDHGGRIADHRHYGNHGNRHQSVSGKSCSGHYGKAYRESHRVS